VPVLAQECPTASSTLLMPQLTAWISSRIVDSLIGEADQKYPVETGGVLIGYWADAETAVVTASVGPGPASVHNRYSYLHDHVWEASQIALHYKRSGRSEVYIGDWHTHPDAPSGNLSFADRCSIRRVIKSREARVSHPLMTILFGQPANWHATIWVAELRSGWWRRSLQVYPVDLHEFGPTDPA
jgi:integrative and conjugative element protein (TIGR02256 family)